MPKKNLRAVSHVSFSKIEAKQENKRKRVILESNDSFSHSLSHGRGRKDDTHTTFVQHVAIQHFVVLIQQ